MLMQTGAVNPFSNWPGFAPAAQAGAIPVSAPFAWPASTSSTSASYAAPVASSSPFAPSTSVFRQGYGGSLPVQGFPWGLPAQGPPIQPSGSFCSPPCQTSALPCGPSTSGRPSRISKRTQRPDASPTDETSDFFDPSATRKVMRKIAEIHVDDAGTPVAPTAPLPTPVEYGGSSFDDVDDMDDMEGGLPANSVPFTRSSVPLLTEHSSSSEEDEPSDFVPNWRMGPFHRHYMVSEPAAEMRYARSLARSSSLLPADKSTAMILYKPVNPVVPVPQFPTGTSTGSPPRSRSGSRVKLELIDSPEKEAECAGLERVSSIPTVSYMNQGANQDEDIDL